MGRRLTDGALAEALKNSDMFAALAEAPGKVVTVEERAAAALFRNLLSQRFGNGFAECQLFRVGYLLRA